MTPKVLIDARKICDGGIGVYIENLVDGLLLLKEKGIAKIDLSLLVSERFYYSAPGEFKKNSTPALYRSSGLGSIIDGIRGRWESKVRFILETAPKYSVSEYIFLPLRQRKELQAHDLYHSPHYTLPYAIKIPKIVTIHDLIHLSHPESIYHRPIANFLINSAAKRADHIITVSQVSCDRLKEFIPNLKTPLSVVPNALRANMFKRPSNEVVEFRKKEFLTRPYCLYIGSDRPHKGFTDLLQSWKELQNSQALDPCPDLIVVGRSFNKVRDQVHEMGLDTTVRFVGEVSTDKLELLYSAANIVLVPSRIEGFGLPALEALGIGVPVICADIPSLREVCEDAAYFVKVTDSQSFIQAVVNVLKNEEEVKNKIRLGQKVAAKFSIEECAMKTWKIYQSVISKNNKNFFSEVEQSKQSSVNESV